MIRLIRRIELVLIVSHLTTELTGGRYDIAQKKNNQKGRLSAVRSNELLGGYGMGKKYLVYFNVEIEVVARSFEEAERLAANKMQLLGNPKRYSFTGADECYSLSEQVTSRNPRGLNPGG